MIYQLDVDGEAKQLITHLPPLLKRKIKESLRAIALEPYLGKLLQEELAGLRGYRVGTFRIVYSMDKNHKTIHIIMVGPRRSIYEEITRRFRDKKVEILHCRSPATSTV